MKLQIGFNSYRQQADRPASPCPQAILKAIRPSHQPDTALGKALRPASHAESHALEKQIT